MAKVVHNYPVVFYQIFYYDSYYDYLPYLL